MSRRARQGGISYKEVDSDGDSDVLTDNDDRVEALLKAAPMLAKGRKGAESSDDAYEPNASRTNKSQRRGTKNGKQSKRTSSSSDRGTARATPGGPGSSSDAGEEDDDEDEEELPAFIAEFSQALLLKLPFEMISEICSHLDLADLIRLAKTSPTLNHFLLASSSRTLWARVRKLMGFDLPNQMSEIGLALMLYGSDCHYCGKQSSFDETWLTRWCNACKGDRLIERRSLKGELGQIHPRLNDCVLVEYLQRDQSPNRWDKFVLKDVRDVNDALWRCEQADEEDAQAVKAASLWSTRTRRRTGESRDLKTDRLETFISERRRYVTRALEEKSQIEENMTLLRNKAAAARAQYFEDEQKREEERVSTTLLQLSNDHAWTEEEVSKLAEEYQSAKDFWRPRELPDPPTRMPNSAPKAWRRYTEIFRDAIARQNAAKASEHRLDKLEVMYEGMRVDLRRKLGYAPSWRAIAQKSKLRALHEPVDADPSANPATTLEVLAQVAAAEVENQRIMAVRDCLAAQLDVSSSTLSLKHGDYPADQYGDDFFARVINRFKLEYRGAMNANGWRPFKSASYLTLQKCARKSDNFNIAMNRKLTRPSWRRAVKHVLAAAGMEDADDLGGLDALGAAFSWTNSPNARAEGSFTWRDMVELVERHGPENLHLADLKNVKIVYTPVKGKGKDDSDADGGEHDLSDGKSEDST